MFQHFCMSKIVLDWETQCNNGFFGWLVFEIWLVYCMCIPSARKIFHIRGAILNHPGFSYKKSSQNKWCLSHSHCCTHTHKRKSFEHLCDYKTVEHLSDCGKNTRKEQAHFTPSLRRYMEKSWEICECDHCCLKLGSLSIRWN